MGCVTSALSQDCNWTLQGDSSVQIEHVGSTAIPTVHAKPILDIAILCEEKGLALLIETLTAIGYDYRGQFDPHRAGHYYAVRDSGEIRLCQAHIFTEPTPDWHAHLKLRDVLRQDYELAREYDDFKLGLAKVAVNQTEYAEIKSRWVDAFMSKLMSARVES